MVAAETLGLPVEAITVNIGDSKYPCLGRFRRQHDDGRRLGLHAARLRWMPWTSSLPWSLPALGVPADQLVAVGGNIQAKGDASKKLAWKEACAKLQVKTIQATGQEPRSSKCKLGDSGVGGVQIADVSVDTETGLVKINKMVAAQDCGLIIDHENRGEPVSTAP